MSPWWTRQLRGDPARLLFQPVSALVMAPWCNIILPQQTRGVSDPTSLRFCWSRHWTAASVQSARCRHSAGGVSGGSVLPSGINKASHYYLDGPACLCKSHQPPAALCSVLWLRVVKMRSELWKYWINSGTAALRCTAPLGDKLYVLFSASIAPAAELISQRCRVVHRFTVVQFGLVYLEMAAYTTSQPLRSLSSPPARFTLTYLLYAWIFMHAAMTRTSCSFFVLARFLTDTWRPRLLWRSSEVVTMLQEKMNNIQLWNEKKNLFLLFNYCVKTLTTWFLIHRLSVWC